MAIYALATTGECKRRCRNHTPNYITFFCLVRTCCTPAPYLHTSTPEQLDTVNSSSQLIWICRTLQYWLHLQSVQSMTNTQNQVDRYKHYKKKLSYYYFAQPLYNGCCPITRPVTIIYKDLAHFHNKLFVEINKMLPDVTGTRPWGDKCSCLGPASANFFHCL